MSILNVYLIMSRSKLGPPSLRVWEWTGYAYKYKVDAYLAHKHHGNCSYPYDSERFDYKVYECDIKRLGVEGARIQVRREEDASCTF